jgi:hypothetical protein
MLVVQLPSGREREDYDGEKPCLDGRKISWKQYTNLSKAERNSWQKGTRPWLDKSKRRQIKVAKAAKKAKAARDEATAADLAYSQYREMARNLGTTLREVWEFNKTQSVPRNDC